MRKVAAVLAIAMMGSFATHAAPGNGDAPFASPVLGTTSCGSFISLLGDQGVLVSFDRNQVARLNADGYVETSWASGGIATVDERSVSGSLKPVLHRTPDGGFLIVGRTVTRLLADGRVNVTYGDSGTSDVLERAGFSIFASVLEPDGSLFALGSFGAGDGGRWAFARLGTRGELDLAFGISGVLVTPKSGSSRPYAFGRQGDGSVQFATYERDNGSYPKPEVRRYPNDFEPTEAAAGRLVPRGVVASWLSPAARVDPQGRLLLGGQCVCGVGRASQLWLARFTVEGASDLSFGAGGRTILAEGPSVFGSIVFPQLGLDRLNLDADGSITAFSAYFSHDAYFHTNQTVLRGYRITVAGERGENEIRESFDTNFAYTQDDYGRLLHTLNGGAPGCQVSLVPGGGPRSDARLVEYRYGERYFITPEGPESAILDADPATEKLRRTGYSFGAWTLASRLPGSSPVCRFNGDPVAGPVGHFYTLQGFECDLVRSDDERLPRGVRTWRFEGLRFSQAPASSEGSCPANLQPVYRLYNNAATRGGDPNHRFTTDPAVVAEMQSKGWAFEGAKFCAPPPAP